MQKFEKTIFLPALLVFGAVMAAVILLFFMSKNSIEKEVNTKVSAYSVDTQNAVKDRLSIFEENLRAGLGLFAGAGTVSKDQLGLFISTSAILERYPGAQSVAYAKVVPAAKLTDFTATAKQTTGLPDYIVYPAGNRDSYAPVIYIEPNSESNRSVLGFDIYSEPVRLKALSNARDSGQVVITDAIQSVVDKTQDGRAFVMYAPQYKRGMPLGTVEQRQKAIEGYLYTGFRVTKFMESVIPDSEDDLIALSVSIGDNKADLYKSKNFAEITKHSYDKREDTLDAGGTKIYFDFVYNQGQLVPAYNSRPYIILFFGTFTALLSAGAVFLMLRGRANQLLLEKERGINEAKDNLLSLASHQLRTPATGVKQYIGLLLQGFSGPITKKQRKLLEKAYAGNERQLKTINDVLYMARLGSGRIVLSKSTFSVVQIVNDILRELQDEKEKHRHTIKLKVPNKQRDFYGDEHMIRMAIENLITNAIKYTRENGEITVRVTFGKDLKITVQDNGIGIEKSQQDRLFKQFERIDNDLSIAVGGSGIGLYVVRNITNLHNGHVEVSSEINEGSRFTIVLPFEMPIN